MSRRYSVQSIQEFGSLTTASNESVVPDGACTELENFDFTQQKTLIKRRGMQVLSWDYPSQLNTMQATQPNGVLWLIGKFSKNTGGTSSDFAVFTDGAKVWYTTYSGYTAVKLTVAAAEITNAKYALQGNDGDLYIITNSTIRKWDPAAAANAVSAQKNLPGTKAVWFKERLFVINTEGTGADSSTCWYSEVADVSSMTGFPAANTFLVGGDDGQYCIDIMVFNDQLFIFKNRSIYVLSADGDPSTWILRQLNPNIGAAGKNTTVVIEGLIYFLSDEGVYRTDGVTFDEISAPIIDQIGGVTYDYVTGASIAAEYYDNKYVLNRPLVGNEMLVFDLYTEQWTKWDFPATIQPYGLEVLRSGSAQRLVVGNSNVDWNTLWYMSPDAYDYDSGTYPYYEWNDDTDISPSCIVATKNTDFGTPLDYKKYIYFEIDGYFATNLFDVYVQHYFDDDKTNYAYIPIPATDNARTLIKCPGPGMIRHGKTRLQFDNDGKIEIFGIHMGILPPTGGNVEGK